MRVEETAIPDVRILHLQPHGDRRGLFVETYDHGLFTRHGVTDEFVQDATSRSDRRGVVRGLHFQTPPFVQAKLVRVARGRIFDVAVDLRRGRPTYGRHVAVELAADDWRMLYIPGGFAHGFCTLTEDTEIAYKLSAPYSPEHARGVLWNDPDLGVSWPASAAEAVVTERDKTWPTLKTMPPAFD